MKTSAISLLVFARPQIKLSVLFSNVISLGKFLCGLSFHYSFAALSCFVWFCLPVSWYPDYNFLPTFHFSLLNSFLFPGDIIENCSSQLLGFVLCKLLQLFFLLFFIIFSLKVGIIDE